MLCAPFHTYSICEQSLGLTRITVSHHHSWDGGINVNSNTDSPPGVCAADLDAEQKNRTSINDTIRSEKIIGLSSSSLLLPHSHSQCCPAQNGSELRSFHCHLRQNGCEITLLAQKGRCCPSPEPKVKN